MKMNKCKCGIIKRADREECGECNGTTKVVKVVNTQGNRAIIKENNLRTKKA